MGESDWQRQYREDALVLGELGQALANSPLPKVEVRLPRSIAEQAVAAWEREGDEGPLDPETYEQRVHRHRAGTLGLIGLSVVNSGQWEDDAVVVELSPDLIGNVVSASDDLPGGQTLRSGERLYLAIVWPEDGRASVRERLAAGSLDAARTQLKERYGEGARMSVWDPIDAEKPR